MNRLSPEARRNLTLQERLSYRLGALARETELGNRLTAHWLDRVGFSWMAPLSVPMAHVDGREHVPLEAPFILAANHRTFFDLYSVMAQIWRHFPRPPFLYCPVRSDYFYDKPSGPLLNLLVAGYAMYPPVFRDGRARSLNRHMVETCVELLEHPRTVVAIHPEGRRNRDPDPYALQPGKVGIARIALRARVPVIPVFVNGLPPSFGQVVRGALTRSGAQQFFFGPPVELADLYDDTPSPAAQQEGADRVMAAIRACADRERAWLAERSDSPE